MATKITSSNELDVTLICTIVLLFTSVRTVLILFT